MYLDLSLLQCMQKKIQVYAEENSSENENSTENTNTDNTNSGQETNGDSSIEVYSTNKGAQ